MTFDVKCDFLSLYIYTDDAIEFSKIYAFSMKCNFLPLSTDNVMGFFKTDAFSIKYNFQPFFKILSPYRYTRTDRSSHNFLSVNNNNNSNNIVTIIFGLGSNRSNSHDCNNYFQQLNHFHTIYRSINKKLLDELLSWFGDFYLFNWYYI